MIYDANDPMNTFGGNDVNSFSMENGMRYFQNGPTYPYQTNPFEYPSYGYNGYTPMMNPNLPYPQDPMSRRNIPQFNGTDATMNMPVNPNGGYGFNQLAEQRKDQSPYVQSPYVQSPYQYGYQPYQPYNNNANMKQYGWDTPVVSPQQPPTIDWTGQSKDQNQNQYGYNCNYGYDPYAINNPYSCYGYNGYGDNRINFNQVNPQQNWMDMVKYNK